jgi:hypothetical protein
MSTLTVAPTYSNGNVLTEAQIDAVGDTIETYFNTTLIDDANIQANALTGSTKLDNTAVTTAKIQSSAITTAKLVDSVDTTDGITTAKIADTNVTTAKIADSAVTAAKIANGAVTAAKINGIPKAVYPAIPVASNTLSDLTVSNSTPTLVGSVSATGLTSGKPVIVSLESSTTSAGSGYIELYCIGDTTGGTQDISDNCRGEIYIYKDGVSVYKSHLWWAYAAAGSVSTVRIPLSSITYIDTASSTSHTYSLYINSIGASSERTSQIKINSAILKTMQLV